MTKNDTSESEPASSAAESIRDRILDAALPDVVFDGWSEALLRRAAASIGVSQDAARLAFPGGASEMAAYFHRRGDAEMLTRLDAMQFDEMRIRDKIATGVRTRLQVAEADEEAVRRSVALHALPPYAAQGMRLMWETADAIWRAAGDSSDDYNWYTKRLTLSGVISSTLLYWLNDSSADKDATWRFLDRRIENVMQFEKLKAQARKNPLAKLVLAGPKALLSRANAPRRDAGPDGLDVGFPGRSYRTAGR